MTTVTPPGDVVPPSTRVVSVYSVTPQLPPRSEHFGLGTVLDVGESKRFLDDTIGLLPRVILVQDVPAEEFCGPIGRLLSQVRIIVLRTPRGDVIVLVESQFPATTTETEIAEYHECMTVQRDSLSIGGIAFVDWLGQQLAVSSNLRLGYTHSIAFIGASLAGDILRVDSILSPAGFDLFLDAKVNYHAGRADRVGWPGVRIPEDLNIPGQVLVAHTRGITIVAGWNERSQDKITLVVVMMIAAFGVLLRTRNRAFDALEAQSRAQVGSIDEAREMIARLADEMSEIQLDLSFGVEAYIDSVLVPDPFMQRFRSSLHDLVGVDTALANTSRMVERLGAVIQSRSAVLATATQEVRERQDRLLTVFFALVSILAIPPTLLLAFFGVSSNDVDSRLSLFDVHRYWPAYVLAWVPFTTLLVVGLLLRRRVRARGPQLTGFS
jgi:hypothetical protein